MPVLDRTYDILGREFDLDELKDVATYGASQGVSGFIYTSELRDIFDDNDCQGRGGHHSTQRQASLGLP
jgi:hypothetical protein